MIPGAQQQPRVYLGNYDPEKRKQEVNQRLEQAFQEIQELNIPDKVLNKRKGDPSNSLRQSKTLEKREIQDIISMQLEEIESEVKTLRTDIGKFPHGSCSNKQYDIMEGHCGKLITDLDNLEVCVSGREQLRQRRRMVLKEIQDLAHQLGLKIHKEGEHCDNGECYKSHKH